MPKFLYTPEGAEPKSWEYDPTKLMSPECEAIERVTGLAYGSEFLEAVGKGSMTAIGALLWVFLKRETPTLKRDEVVFSLDEVDLEEDPEPEADADPKED